MTEADIPPGGEGKVEVTFNTGQKMGRQRKTITITSSDPNNETTRVYVQAFIEVAFGFDSYALNFGKIQGNEPTSKTIALLVKDPDNTQVTDIVSSSEYITATQMSTTDDSAGAKIELEVTINPGIPPGRLNETVTAHSNLPDHPQALLRISGEVKGDIGLVPDLLRFDRYPADSSKTTWVQKLRIIDESGHKPFHVLSVNNPHGHLKLDLETVKPGEIYEVTATLDDEALSEGTYFSGTITVQTDNPDQEMVEARYMIYNRQ